METDTLRYRAGDKFSRLRLRSESWGTLHKKVSHVTRKNEAPQRRAGLRCRHGKTAKTSSPAIRTGQDVRRFRRESLPHSVFICRQFGPGHVTLVGTQFCIYQKQVVGTSRRRARVGHQAQQFCGIQRDMVL
ncbi:hypothetical protein PSPO01_11870 [Paraphaeosphaeria sporulosa]